MGLRAGIQRAAIGGPVRAGRSGQKTADLSIIKIGADAFRMREKFYSLMSELAELETRPAHSTRSLAMADVAVAIIHPTAR